MATFLIQLDELATNGLTYMAKLQEVSEDALLATALEHYARSALTFDEFRTYYPLEGEHKPTK
jgi:hypothetical protein